MGDRMSELQVTNITGATLNNFESQTADALNAAGAAPMFACRAWVNFNGTRNVTDTGASTDGQPVLIRASGNVTSVVKNSIGNYNVNFTTAMEDVNYAAIAQMKFTNGTGGMATIVSEPKTTATTEIVIARQDAGGGIDSAVVQIAIFR